MHSKDFHETAFKEKTNFLKFIYDLGEDGLKQRFRVPGQNFSLWWFSLIAEKSALKSNAYSNLISYLISPDYHRGQDRSLTNPPLFLPREFLRGLISLGKFMLKAIYIKLFTNNFRYRKRALGNLDYLIVTYFPVVDKDKADEGIFENKYIAPFHTALKEQKPGKFSHVGIQIDNAGYSFRETVRLVNKFSKSESIFLLEEFFRFRDIPLLIFYYIYFSIIFAISIPSVSKKFLYTSNNREFNVWHIFKDEMYKSFSGSHLFSTLKFIFLFKQALRFCPAGTKMITIFEMQWWEKAAYIFAKKYGLISIGYQHTIVPELLLSYSVRPQEIESSDFMKCSPIPDHIGTVGNATNTILEQSGWPKKRLFIWGAQRFESLLNHPAKELAATITQKTFVCAFSISAEETTNILTWLTKSFSGDIGYKIILKSHPLFNLISLIKNLGLNLDQNIFETSSQPLEVLVPASSGMIVTESSSAFYAVANQKPVIVPRFANRLDLNPLSYVSDLPFYAYSSGELRGLCDLFAEGYPKSITYEKYKMILEEYFYFPDSNRDYLKTTEEIS